MATYLNKTKLMHVSPDNTLGEFKNDLSENFNIPKDSILVHYGQQIYSNNDDDKLISDLGIKRGIKLSVNHTPAIKLKRS